MDATTIGIDLAKEVFEVAMANDRWRVIKRERLTRPRFERLLKEHPAAHLILEACGSAHYWARTAQRLGHQVTLLPSQYVRPYVRRQRPIGPTRRPCSRRRGVAGFRRGPGRR